MNTSLLIMERMPEQEINCCKCSLQTNTENFLRIPLRLPQWMWDLYIDAVCVSLILMIFLKIKHLDNSNLLLSQVAWSGDAAQP